jgi:hypothetical protein
MISRRTEMITDEMLVARFEEILNLIAMEEGEIEKNYGLKPGSGEGPAYRKGTIVSLCRTSIAELNAGLEASAKQKAEDAAKAAEKKKAEHYKGVAAGDVPALSYS